MASLPSLLPLCPGYSCSSHTDRAGSGENSTLLGGPCKQKSMAELDLACSALSRQHFLHEAREGRSRRHIKETESILLFFKKIEEQDSFQKRSVGVYDAAQPGDWQ